LVFWFWLFLARLPYTCLYWFGWILFPKSFASERPAVIFRNPSFAGAAFDACFAKTPRSGVGPQRGV